jgi:hypothetical protein
MRSAAESAAHRLRHNATTVVLVALLAAGLGAVLVAAWRDDGERTIVPEDCQAVPYYLTATIAPGQPTPGPGTPWPTVVSYALCA